MRCGDVSVIARRVGPARPPSGPSVTAERPEVDRHSRVIAAALLTSICLLPAMLMPYLVGAVALAVTPDSRQLGFVAAAVLGGPIALMAVSAMWVRRYPWRRLVFWGLLLAALGYLLAAAARDFATLVASIAFGSSALAIAYAPPICSLSDTSDPDRNFGYAFFLQIIASGLVGLGATALQDRFGPRSLFVLIATRLCMLPGTASLVPSCRCEARSAKPCGTYAGGIPYLDGPCRHATPQRRPHCRLGVLRAHRARRGLPRAVGGQHDRAGAPHWCAWIVAFGAGGAAIRPHSASRGLHRAVDRHVRAAIYARNLPTYLLAGALFQFMLNFSLSFQYGALSAADHSGRLIVLAPVFQGVGGIGGPIIAGLLAHGGSYIEVGAWSAVYEIAGLALIVGLCKRNAVARADPATPR